jgi:rare lipoprotein A
MRALLLMAIVACVASSPVAAGAQSPEWTAHVSDGGACVEAATYPRPSFDVPNAEFEQLFSRIVRYAEAGGRHRTAGLASYYSSFFDGRKTASGEVFRNSRYSAAHLTLPLGTWIEVKARATGRTLRMRVNDRGPYARKFAIDLSQAAARKLGVDRARDRYVEFRIIALPGEKPLPEEVDRDFLALAASVAMAKPSTPAAGADELTAD